MQQNYYKRFLISNDETKLFAALDSILAYIRIAIGTRGNADNIILRSKWILTELLTNASKHSNHDIICFEVYFTDATLEITKCDYGEAFSLLIDNERKSFPVDFTENKTYVVHQDDLNILYATVYNEGELIFKAQNVEILHNNSLAINEHFGLLIITKSSDKFIYKYDNCTKTNIFNASLVL